MGERAPTRRTREGPELETGTSTSEDRKQPSLTELSVCGGRVRRTAKESTGHSRSWGGWRSKESLRLSERVEIFWGGQGRAIGNDLFIDLLFD